MYTALRMLLPELIINREQVDGCMSRQISSLPLLREDAKDNVKY
jgi:hypothetical protein